jgi:hypothetical protein
MMFRISKSTLSWAGVAVAAILFTLAVPRAAHAVAAALVQVSNTASSPVISQGIGNQAAQIVEIECGYLPLTDTDIGCAAVPATGFLKKPSTSQYTVPAGETLVVTSVDILSGSAAGSPCMSFALADVATSVAISSSSNVEGPRKFWIVPAGAGTVHYVYPSGILFSPGTAIYDAFNSGPGSTCTITIDMHGYLTAQ